MKTAERVMLQFFFSTVDKKKNSIGMWRYYTLPNGTYISIMVSKRSQFWVVKLHSFRGAAKNRDAANLTRHFHGGHLLRKAVQHLSSSINLVIVLIRIDKGHVVINSLKIIWIFNIGILRNVDLMKKKHSRHQQFWIFPLSSFELVASDQI